MEVQIIIIVAMVALITVVYKLLPYRNVGQSKPVVALFPKYKRKVKHSLNDEQLDSIMSNLGFKHTYQNDFITKYSRGSVIGDISIKLAKINVTLNRISSNEHEITLEAGWVAAFDTGDHWKFIMELGTKIENA